MFHFKKREANKNLACEGEMSGVEPVKESSRVHRLQVKEPGLREEGAKVDTWRLLCVGSKGRSFLNI